MQPSIKKSQLSRRIFLSVGLAVSISSIAKSQTNNVLFDKDAIDPPTAYKFARSNQITLLDIRRPDEWRTTGSAKGGHRLDLRRKDFVGVLDAMLKGDRSKPVALICARGFRSNRTSQRLINAGFTSIIDVPEGMLGSNAGPGWIKRKLPLDRS